MHRKSWLYNSSTIDDPTFARNRYTPWDSMSHDLPAHNGTTTRCTLGCQDATGCSTFTRNRSSRNQHLCQLLSEFEKCAQQSEDVLLLRKDLEKMKRDIEDVNLKIEDINFESKLSADKVKFLSKDIQEAKNNHMTLRDEISKEFRKAYKKIGTIDKEIDLIKYRHAMAGKKHQLDLEALKWELKSSSTQDQPVCPPIIDLNCLKKSTNKEQHTFNDYTIV